MPEFELFPEADADLLNIARYTIKTWGAAQAKLYENKLRTAFTAIGTGEIRSRVLFADWPELRVVRCEHHYIFFLIRTKNIPAIVAVWHENMELATHLRRRLQDD